jgi:hypothetical protein
MLADRGTDLISRREGTRLHGPGVGDNSMGLASLLTLAWRLVHWAVESL